MKRRIFSAIVIAIAGIVGTPTYFEHRRIHDGNLERAQERERVQLKK